MFLVFLDMEDESACDLDFGQEVEISEDKEYFALTLIELMHVLLVCKEIIIEIRISVGNIYPISITSKNLILAEASISKRENIISTLDHKHGEVELCQLEVHILDLLLSVRLG